MENSGRNNANGNHKVGNVNGTAVNLLNKYSLPIYTNRLKPRKRYFGAYVAEGATPYVILFNTPCDPQFATA